MIKSMHGTIQKSRGYSNNGLELKVTVSFCSKEFNRIKKEQNPLECFMPQIKNVVFDATNVRGIPSYSRPSMHQQWPRASKGLITLDLYFSISDFNAKELGADTSQWCLYHSVDLNTTLEATRQDGHLFAKTAIASRLGH